MDSLPQFLMIEGAPSPVAPFSHAVRVGPWLLVTGQMPTLPGDDDAPLASDVVGQTRQVIENLRIVLAGCGYSFDDDVMQARIYLTEFARDYAAMNALWADTFPDGRRPARTCIGVTGLARDALVEIDLVCHRVEPQD